MGRQHLGQIPVGVGLHTQPCCRSEEVIDGAEQVGHRDVVAVTGEDSFDGEAADAEGQILQDLGLAEKLRIESGRS